MKVFVMSLLSLLAPIIAVAAEITIKELSDIQFGLVSPTAGTQTQSATFCVALDASGRYSVTAVGSGVGGAFTLQNSASYSVAGLNYQVYVNDRGRRLGRQLEPSLPLLGLRGKREGPNQRCPRPPGRISVRIEAAELAAAPPGRYQGTLSLLVAPE